jgi:hypothetical protein
LDRELKLEWKLSDQPLVDIGFGFAHTVAKLIHEQISDLADMFPLKNSWELHGYLGDGWLAVRISDRHRSGVPVVGKMQDTELEELTATLLPFMPRNHQELFRLLGPTWFAFDRFTYVGPYSTPFACWPDAEAHLVDWLNTLVIPEVLRRNQARVLRAIPPAPQFNLERIRHALWVLECEESMKQGTAFHLSGVGLVTCEHVMGPATHAFRADDFSRKYPITTQTIHRVIDLAILDVHAPLGEGLPMGSADNLKEMDHLAVTGFPNYRLGDSGVIVPGLVIGFRMVSGIRRVLTNAPIIAGNSGGPVLDKDNRVVGVAVTGADRMEEAQETEHHGIIPIDALKFLRT